MKLPTLDAVWVVLALVGVVFAASVEPLPPYDFWWHLVMGRQIELGSIPSSNLFLYTLPVDAPFHDQPWLAQYLMYQAHALGGVAGGMVLRTALLCGAWSLLLWGAIRRSSARIGSGLVLAAALVSYPVLTYRTRLFAFLPFVILLLVLFDDRRPKWSPVVLLAATAWWANVHGTFILAPVLLFGCAGAQLLQALAEKRAGEWARDEGAWWGMCFGASFVGSLATPHGFDNFGYVLTLAVSSNVSSTVSEWLPPDLSTGIGLAFAVAFVAVVGLLAWQRKNVRVLEAALLLATTYLAASAIRSVFWFAAAAVLISAPHVLEASRRFGSEEHEPDDGNLLNVVIVLALIAAAVAVQPGVVPAEVRVELGGGKLMANGDGAGVLSNENAPEAVRIALEASGDGKIFHDQALGGQIQWEAGPDARSVTFVDQRMELIPEPVWDEYFRLSSGIDWESQFEELDVRAAVLSVDGQWPLIQALEENHDWSLRYVGQRHFVFVDTTRSR